MVTQFIPDKESGSLRTVGLMYGFFGLVCLTASIQLHRRLGTRWLADDTGLRMERRGELIWSVPWELYGGWMRSDERSVLAWLSLRNRYDVVGLNGDVVGSLELPVTLTGDGPFFKRELTRNTPTGGPTPRTVHGRRTIRSTPLRCWMLIASGLVSGIGAISLHRVLLDAAQDSVSASSLSKWIQSNPGMVILPLPAYILAAGLAGFGILGLARLTHPAPLGPDVDRKPIYGPSLNDFLLDRPGELPQIEFVEGRTYGYVDSNSLRRQSQSTRMCSAAMRWFILLLPASIFLPTPTPSPAHEPGFAVALAGSIGAFVYGLWLGERYLKRRETQLEDLLRIDGSDIVVQRQGVEHRFNGSPKPRGNPKERAFFSYRLEVGSDEKYRFDPRYLIEMPAAADLTEMAELRDRIFDDARS